ncbi:AEC family transporter [Pararhodobacter zhoushanensis]|uniref:AEC family transporter n=1 Tax=Pararhodobacter zhoushanensis TaxID=2479545 RepID=UPI000F8CF88F|nr:AEC family transporter [Pararhodobacter zhoushanensis]
MTYILATLPVLALILAGYLLVRLDVIPRAQWQGIDTLAFRLLIPAMLIRAIALSDLSRVTHGPFVPALLITLALLAALVLALKALSPGMSAPVFTTLFQAATRWNAFIALTAAEQLAGPEGQLWLAVAMAVTVPVINVVNIGVLSLWGTGSSGPVAVLSMIVRNPLMQACLIGLALNLSGLPMPEVLMTTLDLVGRAALAVGLLAVGAGLMPARLFQASAPMVTGILLRPVVAPALFVGVALVLGLEPSAVLAGALVFVVPAASNGYILARKMGGDAELYAAILTWQTLLGVALIPVLAIVVGALV